MKKSLMVAMLGSMGKGADALVDLMSSDSGLTNVRAWRDRTPNKSNKRTYDFVRRKGDGLAVFRCRQNGKEYVMPVKVRYANSITLGHYL